MSRPFTTEEDALLKDMAFNGFSASHIGKALGRSRNSILGRARRLNATPKTAVIRKPSPTKVFLTLPKDVADVAKECAALRGMKLAEFIQVFLDQAMHHYCVDAVMGDRE
jgi:hypothetical protein